MVSRLKLVGGDGIVLEPDPVLQQLRVKTDPSMMEGLVSVAELADEEDSSLGAGMVANAMARVATVSALRALPAPTRKTVVYLEGYYTPGDGGGGALVWQGTSNKVDNGGTVFQPDSLPANGRWERDSQEISVLLFGAKLDGDGAGGGTDASVILQTVFDYLQQRGAGRAVIPFSGTGFLRADSTLNLRENVEVWLDPRVTLDFTNKATGFCMSATGSIGAEVNTSVNLTTGDTVVDTVTGHDFVAGDWFLLKGQRAALHADAGPDWRLGETTAGTTSPYFAEPCQVQEVLSASSAKCATPIIFPAYRTDNTLETYAGPRTRTTVAKLNLMKGVRVVGGGKIVGGGTRVLSLTYCYEPVVELGEINLGGAARVGVYVSNSLRADVNAKCRRPANWVLVGDHSGYNSFKDVGAWWSRWNVKDFHGCQGLDVSWANDGHPSIWPYVTGESYDSHEDGLNFHSGSYGGVIASFRAYRPKQSGIACASRFVRIINPTIVGPHGASVGSIRFTAWGGVDGGVWGGLLKGNASGYGIDCARTGETTNGPVYRNITIADVDIMDVTTGIYLRAATSAPETNLPSGITIIGGNIRRTSGKSIHIDPYVNDVVIGGGTRIGAVLSGSASIYQSANAVGLAASDIIANDIGAGVALITVLSITDTVTFPSATYKTNRFRPDWKSIKLTGTGTLLSGSYQVNTGVDYTLQLSDIETTVRINAAVARNCLVPKNADVPMPVGAKVRVAQMGTAEVTVAGADGTVTVNSNNGFRTNGQYAVVELEQVATDSWLLSGRSKV